MKKLKNAERHTKLKEELKCQTMKNGYLFKNL